MNLLEHISGNKKNGYGTIRQSNISPYQSGNLLEHIFAGQKRWPERKKLLEHISVGRKNWVYNNMTNIKGFITK